MEGSGQGSPSYPSQNPAWVHLYMVEVEKNLGPCAMVWDTLLTIVSYIPIRHLPPLAATHHDPKVRSLVLMRLAQGGLPQGPTLQPWGTRRRLAQSVMFHVKHFP
jgi:hypothetical protein